MAAVGSFDDETIGRLVSKIVDEVQDSMLNFELQKAAQEEVRRSNVRVYGIKDAVITGLKSSGWDMRLRNEVYKKLQTQPPIPHPLATPEQVKEPVSYIRKAQMNWEKRILKSVNSMCTELSVPLAKKRPEKDQKDMAIKWTELGTDEPDLSRFRPVYAPKDFLEVVSSLKNPNLVESLESAGFSTRWGIVQATLETKDLHDLRLQFSDMSMTQCQGGIDDTSELQAELFLQERERLARKVVDTLHGPVAQEFAKKGCPITYRVDLWKHILGVYVNDIDALYYSQLKTNVLQHDMLVDNLIYKDVKLTASNDDQYFVFEDYLYQVLLPFSRDTMVLKHFAHSSATPAKSYIRGKLGVEAFAVTYPPNGVIPFHGFAMYVAPLCFIYNDPIILYFMFREFYTRYFFHLHTLSSHSQGIVSLSLLFETLLQTQEPQLFFHLKTVGIQPLKIAFKWLIRAFSGYLASEQVLLLWDRILAYNTLEILPVLALAIFAFRKTNLMQVASSTAAEAVLSDLTTLQVIPLIQLSLFTQ